MQKIMAGFITIISYNTYPYITLIKKDGRKGQKNKVVASYFYTTKQNVK